MHEMSIAQGILGIVNKTAEREKAKKVSAIGLLIGDMAGVEVESLNFCFGALVMGTIAEGAELQIKRVPLMGRCQNCGAEEHIEHYNFICSQCGGTLIAFSGRELRVEYIDME